MSVFFKVKCIFLRGKMDGRSKFMKHRMFRYFVQSPSYFPTSYFPETFPALLYTATEHWHDEGRQLDQKMGGRKAKYLMLTSSTYVFLTTAVVYLPARFPRRFAVGSVRINT
jgi:hypothetical protein